MESTENLTPLNVEQLTNLLSRAYLAMVRSGTPFQKFPSVMLWGPPGVGKSQAVRQIAAALERGTGRRVAVTDVRLLLFNPVDLRGIPAANADRTLAVWLKPKIFQMDESENVLNLLFLDEISAAPPSVQAAAYQITLDRMVGEHRLPENCIVIAAGNRVTDKSVAYNMPKALANRLCHFEVAVDAAAWHRWALRAGVHPFVTGYLEYNPAALMRFDPSGTQLAFPTPRSWEMVSSILNTISADVTEVYPLVAGCIGEETAYPFKTWCGLYEKLPDPAVIFAGKEAAVPKAPELRLALRSALAAYARQRPEQAGLDHAIAYACRLPWEFRREFLRDCNQIPALRPLLKQNEVFRTALQKGLQ